MLESIQSQRNKSFQSLFQNYQGPPFSIRLWDGWCWHSTAREPSVCTLVVQSAAALRFLAVRPSEITLGEAFLAKEIDIEGDLFAVFDMAEHLFRCPGGQRQRVGDLISRMAVEVSHWWTHGQRHSVKRDRSAISYHYDQPLEFYQPWLGPSLAYSCAYFKSAEDSIDTAQSNKLEMVCRKLRLSPDDRFLDIGCGWGSLILHAASRHCGYAHGITISQEQAAVAEARIGRALLAENCKAELLDYRHAPSHFQPFDKIASLGMFEHVGRENLPRYFQTVHGLLKPGGVFLNHGIAKAPVTQEASVFGKLLTPEIREIPLLQRAESSSFMDKYVFPEGELVTISEAMRAAESSGFEVRDVENLREHYELTLRCWVNGLQRNADTLLKHVSETTYRIWLLYMAGSAAAFRRGDIAVYQMLLYRPDRGATQLPLTREDWYH